MEKSLNKPYVKAYDKDGVCTNPITDSLIAEFPNRFQRRAYLNQPRFHGNGKNYPLTVLPTGKYVRYRQFVDGKTIEHYQTS